MTESFKDKLREELEYDEGVKYEIYLDHLGLPTFGIGHLVKEDDPEHGMDVGTEISEERCKEVFSEDIRVTLKDCEIIFEDWDKLPEEARLVTANMCFQLGRPRLSKFKKTIDACNRGSWSEMATEMRDSKWNKQTPERSERLIERILDLGETL